MKKFSLQFAKPGTHSRRVFKKLLSIVQSMESEECPSDFITTFIYKKYGLYIANSQQLQTYLHVTKNFNTPGKRNISAKVLSVARYALKKGYGLDLGVVNMLVLSLKLYGMELRFEEKFYEHKGVPAGTQTFLDIVPGIAVRHGYLTYSMISKIDPKPSENSIVIADVHMIPFVRVIRTAVPINYLDYALPSEHL